MPKSVFIHLVRVLIGMLLVAWIEPSMAIYLAFTFPWCCCKSASQGACKDVLTGGARTCCSDTTSFLQVDVTGAVDGSCSQCDTFFNATFILPWTGNANYCVYGLDTVTGISCTGDLGTATQSVKVEFYNSGSSTVEGFGYLQGCDSTINPIDNCTQANNVNLDLGIGAPAANCRDISSAALPFSAYAQNNGQCDFTGTTMTITSV